MIAIPRHHLGKIYLSLLIVGICLFTIIAARLTHSAFAASQAPKSGQHILTVYDDGTQKGFLTSASTLGEALKEAKITLAKDDITEPGLDQKLVSSNYDVTIYRARPVLIIDGESRTKVITAYHTGKQIAAQAGITLHDEDSVDIESSPDVVADGAPERMLIKRATPFTLVLYGKTIASFTQSKTVQDVMKEKGIKLAVDDTLSVPQTTTITAGMTIEIWRNGIQTTTEQEAVPFPVRQIQDGNQPIGYKQVQTPGKNGSKMVTYEITVKNGIPVNKKSIQEVAIEQPVEQVEVVGAKSTGGLTKSKGVDIFVDSNGVAHRETYYNLDMSRVATNCGNGGVVTIRADGVKVDANGYILIAANLSRYPRCSIQQTSLGLAKVYDTGGFVAVHPDGYDIATNW